MKTGLQLFWASRRGRGAILALLTLAAVFVVSELSAEVYSYCDSLGRKVVYVIDDTGHMTVFMRTVNPSPDC